MAKMLLLCSLLISYAAASTVIQPSSSVATPLLPSQSASIMSSQSVNNGMISPTPAVQQMPASSSQTSNLTFGYATTSDFKIKVAFKLNETWNDKLNETDSAERAAMKTRIFSAFSAHFTNSSYFRESQLVSIAKVNTSIMDVQCFVLMKTAGVNDTESVFTPIINALSMAMNQGIGDLNIIPLSAQIAPVLDGTWSDYIEGVCNTDTGIKIAARQCIGPFNGGAPCVERVDVEKVILCEKTSGSVSAIPIVSISGFMILLTIIMGM